MSSETAGSGAMSVSSASDVEYLKRLIHRLRPGDQVSYQTARLDPDTGEPIVRQDSRGIVSEVDVEDGYYRVFLSGPRGGRYVIYPETPEGKGAHEPPELFHISSDSGGDGYTEITENSVVSLSIVAEREL